jgi:hypothetical protein
MIQPAKVDVLSSDIISTTLKCSVQDFDFREVNTPRGRYRSLILPNSAPLLLAGTPELVKVACAVIIPDRDAMELSVISAKYFEYHDIDLVPSRGDLPRTDGPEKSDYVWGENFGEDNFFPGRLADATTPFIVRDFRGQVINFYPFQYNPVSRCLRVYGEITVQIATTGEPGENPLVRVSGTPTNSDPDFNALYRARFVNGCQVLHQRNDPPGIQGRMLIIAFAPFMDALRPLVEWKTSIGIPTEMVDVAAIGDAPAIRAYVENYYRTKGLTYLLLAGDAQHVPPFDSEYGPSDISYGFVAGNDHYPDLFVGRFSAETTEEIGIQVTRTITYERDPDVTTNWMAASIGIASAEGPGDDGEMDYEHVRNLQTVLSGLTYIRNDELFDGSQGQRDLPGNPTVTMVTDDINDGAGLILYTGVSNSTCWMTSGFSGDDVKKLTNAGAYPVIIAVGCKSGCFVGRTCLAESWLRASYNGCPIGAVAAFMSSINQSWYPPMEGQDQMIGILADDKNNDVRRTIGGLTAYGCMGMNDKYGVCGYKITDTWVLFGDPSLQMRTAMPEGITVEHPDVIGYDNGRLTITTGLTEGYVTMTADHTILASEKIFDGKAVLTFNKVIESDSVTLTVTSLNRIPYICRIPVVKIPTPVVDPAPATHSRMVSAFATLKWTKGEGANPDHYQVFLGTDNPPSNILNGFVTTDASFKPACKLAYQKQYYWKIVAVNHYGSAVNEILDFTVNAEPDMTFENGAITRDIEGYGNMDNWWPDGSCPFDGNFSARSAAIGDNGSSSMYYRYDSPDDDYTGFWVRVSSEKDRDRLLFLVDDVIVAVFSGEVNWSEHYYPVPSGSHVLEWRYMKDGANASGADRAWLDDIYLPLNRAMTISAGDDDNVCADGYYRMNGHAYNYSSVCWMTPSKGHFTDAHALNPLYIPDTSDLALGRVRLTLTATNMLSGKTIFDEMVLDFLPLPDLSLLHDTLLHADDHLILDASPCNAVSYLWLPSHQSTPSLLVDTTGTGLMTQDIKLYVTGENGCINQKTIHVNFEPEVTEAGIILDVYPNPSHGWVSYNIISEDKRIYRIKAYDSMGRVIVMKDVQTDSGHVNGNWDLTGLREGIYIIQAEGVKCRTSKAIVIQ